MTLTGQQHFERGGWWDPDCAEFRSLRRISEFRLSLLRRWIPGGVRGRVVVDYGCGGGLLALPLAADGARVVGVDLSRPALREASTRGQPGFQAVSGDLAAAPIAGACADVALLADVLEHVADPAVAVAAALRSLRPGGYLFVNTIHRTLRSRLLAITLGEGLGLVPRGTHKWRMFVTPSELDAMSQQAGAQLMQRTGEAPRIWSTLRERAIVLRESSSLAVGYAALYRRTA